MNDTFNSAVNTEEDTIVTMLGLADMSEAEREEFLESVGSVVIESAVLKFMVSLSLGEQQVFESWLETHKEDSSVLEKALETYPLFAEIVQEEMEAFQSETKRLLGV
jgi:hypothetical protein